MSRWILTPRLHIADMYARNPLQRLQKRVQNRHTCNKGRTAGQASRGPVLRGAVAADVGVLANGAEGQAQVF
jgi:hypothetical protein